MVEVRMRSAAADTVRTIDRGTVSVGRIKNMASELQSAGKRLEGYGINSAEGESSAVEANDADGEMAGRLVTKPAGAMRLTDKAKGLIKSRSFIRKQSVSEATAGRAATMSAAEIKAYQEAGRKAFQKKKHMETAAVKMRRAGVKLLEKANALIRLRITASKSLITVFAALGGAGAVCLAVVVIVSGAAVIFEMAGCDEEALVSGLDASQFTEAAFGEGSEDIVKTAEAELGNKGGKKYWKWYGFDERVEWCACFCSWCGAKCGLIDQNLMPKFADCKAGLNWFRKKNRFLKRSASPNPGWLIFFDWDSDGTINHVGIVEKCDGDTVYTIEGNSGDKVRRRQYSVKSKIIEGYGVIAVEKKKDKDKTVREQ